MQQSQIVPFAKRQKQNASPHDYCVNCSVKDFCLPLGLESKSVLLLDNYVKKVKTIQKGEVLFKPQDAFNKLYVVRSGALKTYLTTKKGDEKIVSFNLPGEILGFDALQSEKHTLTATALEVSSICYITFKDLFLLAAEIPTLQHRLLTLASKSCDYHDHIKLNSSAMERLSFFLLNLSERFKRRGFSPVKFNLSMSRSDIANYLGLTIETTSRLLTKLQKEEVIALDKRYLEILNLRELQMLTC